MDCEKCRELLWQYLAQEELSKADVEQIETHLSTCDGCKNEAAELQEIMASLRTLPEEDLPEGYHSELMGKLAKEANVIPLIVKKKPKYRWKQFSLIAAAALLIVAVDGAQGFLRSDYEQKQQQLVENVAQNTTQNKNDELSQNVIIPDKDNQDALTADENQPEEDNSVQIKVNQASNSAPRRTEVTVEEQQNVQPQKTAITEPQKTTAPEPQKVESVLQSASPSVLQGAVGKNLETDQSEQEGVLFKANTADETALGIEKEVILTVKSKDKILDDIRELTVSLGGSAEEQVIADTIRISVPQNKEEYFMEGLKKLGEVRTLEISSETMDDITFQITIELA
ncbi:MAG: zf-HC2 domain-containing protein [Anaerotignum sp.]